MTKSFEGLNDKVVAWASERGLHIADPKIQWMRVTEEVGEIRDVLLKPTKFENPEQALKDAIGDSLVTLIVLATQLNLDLVECLEIAYKEIKDRNGKNGQRHIREVRGFVMENCKFSTDTENWYPLGSKVETEIYDSVTKPKHYQGKYGLEVVDVIKNFIGDLHGMRAAYFFNVVKYILRFQWKNGVEDLKKARQHLDWLIEEMEEVE